MELLPLWIRINHKERITMLRQLSIMVSASVPIVEALRTSVRQTGNAALQEVLYAITQDVEGGVRLSVAFGRFPEIFNPFFVNVIKSGETTGRLDEVLNYLADAGEQEYELVAKIRGALIYPAFILVSMITVGIIMLVFVLPQLTSILTESGATLPWTTRILIGVSNFVNTHGIALSMVTIALLVGIIYGKRTPGGKIWWDWLRISIPIGGNITRTTILVRLVRNLHTLLAGGVPLAEALATTAEVVDNEPYKQLLLTTEHEIRDGHPLASVFAGSSLIPSTAHQIIAVGEQTGKLDEVLMKLAQFYTRELEQAVRNLISLIEPIIIVIMGVGVGIMVGAIILPLYQMASTF